MADPIIVAIIFRFINFICIIGLIIYAIKTRLLPALRSKIAAHARVLHELALLKNTLHERTQALEHVVHEEEIRFDELKQKVTLWNEKIEHTRVERVQQQERYNALIKEHVHARQQALDTHRVRVAVMPLIMQNVTHTLQKHCADDQYVQSYMQRILNFMHKSTQ